MVKEKGQLKTHRVYKSRVSDYQFYNSRSLADFLFDPSTVHTFYTFDKDCKHSDRDFSSEDHF